MNASMHPDELTTLFNQQAAGYDQRWAKLAAIREGMDLVLKSLWANLPADARVLAVGVGTGVELASLAETFPRWTFTAVDPSGAMLDVCRQRAVETGFADRCTFHQGYLASLPPGDAYDVATCLLVSQFLLDREERSRFFQEIADRLRPGGWLASSDLAADVGSAAYERLLTAWLRMMAAVDLTREEIARMRAAYDRDVAILPPQTVAEIIAAGGFEQPTQFFQAGLLHAWIAERAEEM